MPFSMINLESEVAKMLTDLASSLKIAPDCPVQEESLKESISFTEQIADTFKTGDFSVNGQQHAEKKFHVTVTKPRQAEEDTNFQPNCGKSSAPRVGCKARRKLNLLTEDEKKERRFLRMLANRESAKLTILRRQARRVELERKAAELEYENEKLRKIKEVAMKEHEFLKRTNESLKAQLNLNRVTMNVEVEETPEGSKFDNAHIPTSTSTRTQPSSLPHITPGSSIVQSAPQNGIACTSKIRVLTEGKTSLSEHENPARTNVPGIPFALPYTWLFPPYYANGVPPWSSDLAHEHNITKASGTSSFQKPLADVKNDQRYPLKKTRGEASTSTVVTGPSAQVHCGKASGKELAHKHKVTSAAVTVSSSEGNEESVIGLHASPEDAIKRRNEFITSAGTTSSSSEEDEDQNDGRLLRRQMDAFAAAAARKRRKDIVKMKNFHYSRQSHVKT
ncbi:uncharacterized protein LOC108225291 isoform X1 [Daucus carota subsp. sativus]|uniref:uncharacterized protein LOC108225291 isoform X1 n=1 Tax=Daucus carota subsp. sativus TaxID=79200 RepID=UPI0007EF0B68|nr:PREDICTED: uncharacterized protein LOC108225291 isoform X2 [Daucus carota subsp. sativus]